MDTTFWIKRFLAALVVAIAVICAAQLLKGHTFAYALREAAIWGILTAMVYTAALFYRIRRGQQCAVCQDTPDKQESEQKDPA